MDMLPVDIILLGCTAFSFVYTLVHFVRGSRNFFNTFMFLGFTVFFAGKLYTLIFELCGGDSSFFTLGDLGTVSGFMFFTYAILTIRRFTVETRSIDIRAFAVPALMLAGWIVMLVNHLDGRMMIDATLYIIAGAPCSYLCLKAILNSTEEFDILSRFHPLLAVIIIQNVMCLCGEIFWVIDAWDYSGIAAVIILACSAVCYVAMPVLLQRGNKKWRA